ncbi:MAG TPA: EF-hand domain-containing protein [Pseudoxanthomonas sp.]|nr:EF-hand domain-containing protein [Pseudoxanthomonas sp.]
MSSASTPLRRRFSTRRKALLALVTIALALAGWLHLTGAAGISGMPIRHMDWNGDGRVSHHEILQAFYGVRVTATVEGPRECKSYLWRGGDRAIRLDCRTEMTVTP